MENKTPMDNKDLAGECLDIQDTLASVNSAVFFLVNVVAEMKDLSKKELLCSDFLLDGMLQVQRWIDRDTKESIQKLEYLKEHVK